MKAAILVAAALFVSGCAPATRLIVKPAAKEQPVASKEAATLVVGTIASWAVLNLIDESGTVVGQLGPRTHTVIQRPAGEFKLYVVPEKQGAWGDRVEGTLEAGRVYFVNIGARYGGVSAGALSARTDPEEWPNRKTYVSDLDRVNLDSAQVSGLMTELGDTKALMAQVDTVVGGFEAADKAKRKFEPADGEN